MPELFDYEYRHHLRVAQWELKTLERFQQSVRDHPENIRANGQDPYMIDQEIKHSMEMIKKDIARFENRIETNMLIGTTDVWVSADRRFYIGKAAFRDGLCIQYLELGGRREYCKIYVDTHENATAMVALIRGAEEGLDPKDALRSRIGML